MPNNKKEIYIYFLIFCGENVLINREENICIYMNIEHITPSCEGYPGWWVRDGIFNTGHWCLLISNIQHTSSSNSRPKSSRNMILKFVSIINTSQHVIFFINTFLTHVMFYYLKKWTKYPSFTEYTQLVRHK